MDSLFVIDIIINFRTSVVLFSGEEISNPKVIAKTYVSSGRFFIDLLAVLPL